MHFASSARTVDLLGRQQIAGASTAISEIFKNAHDAYATKVQIDVVGTGEMLTVRDDGVGMSPAEFEYRWLTLAASKAVGPEEERKPPAVAKRPVLGAKGIGRLAVAIIGRNVAVITRAKGEEATVAFVPWRLFEIPGLTLDDIQIASRRVSWESLGPHVLEDVVHSALGKLSQLENVIVDRGASLNEVGKVHDVATGLMVFDSSQVGALLDPEHVFLGSDTGTAFLVFPVDNEDVQDLAQSRTPADQQLVRDLLGFFLPADLAAELSGRTRARPSRGSLLASDMVTSLVADDRDLLAESEFFTVEDLHSMDHQVVGTFDEDGYFRGQVSVYGSEPAIFELPWRTDGGAPVGKRPKCGPFDFWTSALEGAARDSELDQAEHKRLTDKLDGLGGVYVYRNGVRVLPYGRPNFDWLGIEERRTKHLSRNYFSHRRMFGAIVVDGEQSGLEEKAGREGFISNQAYRDLRDILTRFFRELAANFFVKGGELAGKWESTRDHKREVSQSQKYAEQQAKNVRRRQQLEKEVAEKYVALEEDLPLEVEEVLGDFTAALSRHESGDRTVEPAAAGAVSLYNLLELESRYRQTVPPGLGLNAELVRDFRTYEAAYVRTTQEYVEPARERIYRELSNQIPGVQYESITIDDLTRRGEHLTVQLTQAVEDLKKAIPEVGKKAHKLIAAVEDTWASERDRVVNLAKSTLDEGVVPLVEARRQAEASLSSAAEHLVQAVEGYSAALCAVDWTLEAGAFFTSSDVHSREQTKVLDLEEAAVRSSPLLMRGMMLASLEHEFNNVISSLRRSVRRLGGSDLSNGGAIAAVEDVETAFEHLDGFLGILSPLRRTSATRPTQISGRQIRRFITSVFKAREGEQSARLEFADDFDDFQLEGHRSVWYPVMVNLVDNAMFWAARSDDVPLVTVGADGEAIWVEDNGPGVSPGDRESIWEPQFSRKPGGTGLGLGISRNAMEDEGYVIELAPSSSGGARFEIREEGKSPAWQI